MDKGNYIKLYRNMLDWEWWHDINTCRLFIFLLLKANWKEGRFEGQVIPRGSFVSSLSKLSYETSLTVSEIRTAIGHLKSTGELTVKRHAKYSVFTVNNYTRYQDIDNQMTGKQQSVDSQLTTIEEDEKGEERKKDNISLCKTSALELFEKLWKLYPVKKGKGQVSLAAKQRLLKVGYEEMVRAIDRYKKELEKDSDWRKPQNGSTFFNSGYVDYLDDNFVPSEQKAKSGKGKNKFHNFQERECTKEDMDDLERRLLEG